MSELATFEFPLKDEVLYDQVRDAINLVEGAGYSPKHLVLPEQCFLWVPFDYPGAFWKRMMDGMSVERMGWGSLEGFAIGAEPYPTLKHEYAPAGMLRVCRWCGELEGEMGEAETGCPVPLANRFLERKLAALDRGVGKTLEFRRYGSLG